VKEGLHLAINSRGSIDHRLSQFNRGQLTCFKRSGQLGDGFEIEFGHFSKTAPVNR
jgi:hypothetical protein